MTSTLWSAGRYESVGARIAGIADETVEAADRRTLLHGATIVDLGCGTGSATLAAAAHGAHVTAVDLTPELIDIAKSKAGSQRIDWVVADAADTGLAAQSFDAAVSNLGIIFVEPVSQVAEISRLLKPGGTLAFSSWVRDVSNPLFDPVVAVTGAPSASGFRPDQWGDEEIVASRLQADYRDIDIERRSFTWQFSSLAAALKFVTSESPMHVAIFRALDDATREKLEAAFDSALQPHVHDDGSVAFDVGYVLITATRR
jgi:SAM-dependent methyltransferase